MEPPNASPREPWLVDWLGTVGPLSARSSRLVMALCAAFAAPLYGMARLRPVCIHLYGPQAEGSDAEGRQLVLRVPACLYGRDGFQSGYWHQFAHNPAAVEDAVDDGLLILSTFDDTPHGHVIDAAGVRWFDRKGAKLKHWERRDRVTLSCGALPIDPALLRTLNGPGKTWVVNVPKEAFAGDGMFEEAASLNERSMLDIAAEDCAGWPGLRWLEHLNRKGRVIADRWEREADDCDSRYLDPDTHLPLVDVAMTFSRLAAAGEEATAAGLTGWAPGTAKSALWKCFVDMTQDRARRAGLPLDASGTLTLHAVLRDELGGMAGG